MPEPASNHRSPPEVAPLPPSHKAMLERSNAPAGAAFATGRALRIVRRETRYRPPRKILRALSAITIKEVTTENPATALNQNTPHNALYAIRINAPRASHDLLCGVNTTRKNRSL